MASQTIRNVESENECISTNICSKTNESEIMYAVGLSEEECGQVSGTWTIDKATFSNINDIYWRIIRTNEDGSVKMLYSGLNPLTTTGYIGTLSFNESYNDPMYVGYMYGTSGSLENNRTNTNDSTIKIYIDNWYENTLLTNYDKYLSKTAIYCNDRSVPSTDHNGNDNNYSTSYDFDYGAYTRLNTNKTPSYKCGANTSDGLFEDSQAIEDKFSASTNGGGNGQLKYPVALMTADEISFAGGQNWTTLGSPYAWYYTNSQGESITGSTGWWTMSPTNWSGYYIVGANVWYVVGSRSPGELNYDVNQSDYGVRPTISLASCVGIKFGDGTPSYPYVIDESSCS